MSTGFKIAMLNTGGPNNKPLEYGGISAAQMKLLETQTLVTMDDLLTGGQYLYNFIKGTVDGEPRLTRFNLLESDFIMKKIIPPTLYSNVLADRESGIVIPPKTSRFLQSVQSDELDIYSPKNLAAFISDTDVETDVEDAINKHLQKLYNSAFVEENGELMKKEISETHYGEDGGRGNIDKKITKENAKGFFVLGFMLYQANSMVELSNLTKLPKDLRAGLVKELETKGAKINVSKKEILQRLANSQLDIVMLNECQEGDGEIKGEVDITKFFAVEGKANKGQVSQLLIRKDKVNGTLTPVTLERQVPFKNNAGKEMVKKESLLKDVAESVFVTFEDTTGQKYLVGVMHYSSYDHKPLGEKERNTDSRVQAVLKNLATIKAEYSPPGYKVIVGMDTNSARLLKSDIEAEGEGFKLLSPSVINQLMETEEPSKLIANKATSTTLTPTVLKARTRFQAQKNKVDLLDCCSKDIIVSLNYDTTNSNPHIFTTNASGFTKAPTLGTQIIIDEKGMVTADHRSTFMANRIPNGDYPFDHFIVASNANAEHLEEVSLPEAGNTPEAVAAKAAKAAEAAAAKAAEAEAAAAADAAAEKYVTENRDRLLLKQEAQKAPKAPSTRVFPDIRTVVELGGLSKREQTTVLKKQAEGDKPLANVLTEHSLTSRAKGGGRKTKRRQQRRSQAQRRQSQRQQRRQSRRQQRRSQTQRQQSRRQSKRQQSRRQPKRIQSRRQQSRRTQKRRN